MSYISIEEPEIPTPEQIRKAREDLGISQTLAASLIYTSRSTWAKWEAGDRRMHPAFWELFLINSKNIL